MPEYKTENNFIDSEIVVEEPKAQEELNGIEIINDVHGVPDKVRVKLLKRLAFSIGSDKKEITALILKIPAMKDFDGRVMGLLSTGSMNELCSWVISKTLSDVDYSDGTTEAEKVRVETYKTGIQAVINSVDGLRVVKGWEALVAAADNFRF